ncbi:DUF4880 domain-containing protein [Bowmanella sp. Y26]|uniref:FecR family protein n=1 Tax=Bowmanella yangjiangensis TaxID=2811230 RepID=UPI001BDBF83E|nr:DUF4880 domain-containing protein [Bowmanella yangjiangensis]MBT1063787.1 DUF4880 domain-containing protein [Bowmanella yangjiangensis]
MPKQSLEAAAYWFVELREQQPDAETRLQFEDWLSDPEHQSSWQKVLDMHSTFEQFNLHQQQNPALHSVLQQPLVSRRAVLKCVALFGVSFMTYLTARTPLAKSTWYQMAADYSVPVGQSAQFPLAEHIQLWLNTNSAVDVNFANRRNQIVLLQGEVFVEHAGRGGEGALQVNTNWQDQPLAVESGHCQFNLYQHHGGCELSVYQGQAVFHGRTTSKTLQAGQQISLGENGFSDLGTVKHLPGWRDGKLIAQGMSLQAFASELNRYRQGVIRVEPDAQALNIDGVFPAFDSDKALEMLASSLPVKVSKVGPWWVQIALA